jgi:hypothetical protein
MESIGCGMYQWNEQVSRYYLLASSYWSLSQKAKARLVAGAFVEEATYFFFYIQLIFLLYPA